MEYYLMRKDDVVTICDITKDGIMVSYSDRFRNPELAPLEYRASSDHIRKWWLNRHIPVREERLEQMFRKNGLSSGEEYLIKNLGLSLTDYYWMKPVDSQLRWADVNLFDNDFSDNLLDDMDADDRSPDSLSPNSSLKGELEKSWIIKNGKRMLVKGNHGRSSQESINEVIASRFHEAAGYNNYTQYSLIHIKGKPYDFGCLSESFTDQRLELVSAHAVLTSEKKPEALSMYEFLIDRCIRHGIDGVRFRKDLEYQIVSDYILSNVDRHMENIGILRDAETLEFVRMAPIFDTGRAFGGSSIIPSTDEEIDNIEINSFLRKERDMLDLITDRTAFDMSGSIPPETINTLCRKDSRADDYRVNSILKLYAEKLKRFKIWQEA